MASLIERNGLSGLVLRGAVIASAAVKFGCAPKAPVARSDAYAAALVDAHWVEDEDARPHPATNLPPDTAPASQVPPDLSKS